MLPLKSLAIIWILSIFNSILVSTNSFSCRNYTGRINKFIWATFVHHWDLLLRDCSERREKEAQKMTTHKTFIKKHVVQQSKQRRQIISVDMLFFGIQEFGCENKLQFDEKNNKNWKNWKTFEYVYHKISDNRLWTDWVIRVKSKF